MDYEKVGNLIARLRREQNMTQQQLADRLHVSNKTVSKWECGQGCPDAALWAPLSAALDADVLTLLRGELGRNKRDIGRLDRVRFYVCPDCGNIMTATSPAEIVCCGRRLSPLEAIPADAEHEAQVEVIEFENYVTLQHPMEKEHYISFVAYVHDDRILLAKLYPEQEAALYLPKRRAGRLYAYCTVHGLMRYPFKL